MFAFVSFRFVSGPKSSGSVGRSMVVCVSSVFFCMDSRPVVWLGK